MKIGLNSKQVIERIVDPLRLQASALINEHIGHAPHGMVLAVYWLDPHEEQHRAWVREPDAMTLLVGGRAFEEMQQIDLITGDPREWQFAVNVCVALREWGATIVESMSITRNDVKLTRGAASGLQLEQALQASGIPAWFTRIDYHNPVPDDEVVQFDGGRWVTFSVEEPADDEADDPVEISEPKQEPEV